jgi:hypothetical protein
LLLAIGPIGQWLDSQVIIQCACFPKEDGEQRTELRSGESRVYPHPYRALGERQYLLPELGGVGLGLLGGLL